MAFKTPGLLLLLMLSLLMRSNVMAFVPKAPARSSFISWERGLISSTLPSTSRISATIADLSTTRSTLKDKLAAAGRGGLLSYGILNCAYYVSVTMATYVYYLKSGSELLLIPSTVTSMRDRLVMAITKMSKIAAIVWAGSQITKAFRIGAAIATAPLSEKLLDKFGSSNKQRSFSLLCRGLLSFTFFFYAALIIFTAIR